MGQRTRARECAFQMLYQKEMTGDPIDEVAAAYWRVRTAAEATGRRAQGLAKGALDRLPEIDAAITRSLDNWRLDRLASVDRSILRLATYELLAEPGTPSAVILDEAVEMAKRFGEADSAAFINGVLDAIRKSVRGEGG
jgi:N utilization substance protein B